MLTAESNISDALAEPFADLFAPSIDAMMGSLRASQRLTRFFGLSCQYLLQTCVERPLPERGAQLAQAWARPALELLGIELSVEGLSPERPALLIANHRSDLDLLALLSATSCAFLIRADSVRRPLLLRGAQLAGCALVQAEDPQRRGEVGLTLRKRLAHGTSVVIFPELPLGGNPGLGAFRDDVFQIAAAYELPVIPVAIGYPDGAELRDCEESLTRRFFTRASRPRTRIQLAFGPRISGSHGRTLKHEAESFVARHLLGWAEESLTAWRARD